MRTNQTTYHEHKSSQALSSPEGEILTPLLRAFFSEILLSRFTPYPCMMIIFASTKWDRCWRLVWEDRMWLKRENWMNSIIEDDVWDWWKQNQRFSYFPRKARNMRHKITEAVATVLRRYNHTYQSLLLSSSSTPIEQKFNLLDLVH